MSEPTLFIPPGADAKCAECCGTFCWPGRKTCPGCGSTAWTYGEPDVELREQFETVKRASTLSLVPAHASDEAERESIAALERAGLEE